MPAKAGIQYSPTFRLNGSAYPICYYVYILASQIGGTLYVGVTNDLIRRVFEHKSKFARGFTKRYDVIRLVYYEQMMILSRRSCVRRD
jgi:predicted GIY-YIG superfamily endonuclease